MKPKSSFQTSIGKYLKFIAGFAVINIISMLFPIALEAATYYSRVASFTFAGGGNNWSTSSSGGTLVAYPGTTHSYIIQPGHTVTLGAAQTVAGITVNSGGTLIAGSNTLTINGNWTHDGTFTSSGMVTFTTVAAASISGGTTLTLNNLTVGAATTLTLNNNVTVAGNVTMTVPSGTNTGITIAGTNSLNVTGTMNLPVPGNNNRNVNVNVNAGSLTVGGLFTMSATTSGSRLNFLNISTGTVNLNGGITTGTTACRIVFSGSGTLNINGAVTGGPPAITESTGTINFNRATAQTVWNETYYNLTLSGGGIKTNTTVTVNNILSMEGTATASAAPTYGANATLMYNTATARNAGVEWLATFVATGGVVIANTGAINPNGNKVFNVNIPLNINSGATLSPGASTFSFGGDLINDGIWTASTGAVTITLGRTTQSIGRFNTTGLVTMSKASGTATFTGDINGGAFTMAGAGTLNLGTGRTHTFTGAWANTSGSLEGNTSTLNIGGPGSVTSGTFTAGTSTVNFNGGGAQNIPGFSYYNLNTATGGTKTMLAATTVTNVLTVGLSSTFATGANTLTLSGTGTPLVDNGTFTATAGGTVIYSGATANIAAESYANLQTSTAGVKTLAGNTTVTAVLTVNSPSTLATGANTLTLTGTGTPLVDNGTFTASSGSTVIYSGATATVAGESYANLQVSTAGAKTLGANTTVSEVLTINTGSTIALSTFTLTLSGTGTPLVNSGGTFTASTGTVIYSGATATVAALTYHNLQTSTAGSKTLAGTTSVNNILTINSPSTLNLSSFTLTLSGAGTPLVNNGTFTCSTSTVNFSNAGSVNIPALNYNNLNITGGARVFANSGTIGIAAVFTPGAGAFTVTGSKVEFNGAAQTIPAFNFNDLVLSGTGAKTIPTATTVSVNAIDILNGPTLDIEGTAAINVTKP